MKDKRIAPRKETIYYLQATDPSTGTLYGRVVDLSESGLLLVTAEPESLPQTFSARIESPPGADSLGGFTCSLVKRWQRRDHNPDLVLVGCAMDLDDSTVETVAALIARYSFGREIHFNDR